MRALPLAAVLLVIAGCSGDIRDGADTPAASAGAPASTSPAAASTPSPSPVFDEELHDELMAMLERDQTGRTGGDDHEGDVVRSRRLAEILDRYGWPTNDLVGEDGEDAAWTIAQHADHDPELQARALELLREAVAAGQASPGNLAYLTDRVAVGAGRPQTYGTQMGCGSEGPTPATPLVDPAAVDALRAEAGLEPLADYLAEMAAVCAED